MYEQGLTDEELKELELSTGQVDTSKGLTDEQLQDIEDSDSWFWPATKGTLKAIPRVVAAGITGMAAFPTSGVFGLARLLQTGDLGEAVKMIEKFNPCR